MEPTVTPSESRAEREYVTGSNIPRKPGGTAEVKVYDASVLEAARDQVTRDRLFTRQ
jgi:hypothetical protein